MHWRGINTENSVIRESNLKEHKPTFWISVNLWHLQHPDEEGQAILLCGYLQERKRWRQTNYFSYGVFGHGWYEFQLKYWRLCFGFCKIEVPDFVSRDLWCHQNCHICCSLWKFREKNVPSFGFIFLFIMKINEVFKTVKKNISFYERKNIYYKNMKFARKEKFILWIFQMRKTFILWISGSKRVSFSEQEVGRKIFPYYLRNLHDILRTETDVLFLKKTIKCYFL